MTETAQVPTRRFLLYGGTGWIGQKLLALFASQGDHCDVGRARLEDRAAVAKEVLALAPTHVINAAGVTGRPNVDWCETHQAETIRANVVGCLNVVDVCHDASQDGRGTPIHCTVIGSGCIFTYDDAHPMHSDKLFTEDDRGNFTGSFYAKTKGMLEEMLRSYPNVCVLRFRMPLSDDLHDRSLLTKLLRYPKVINIPNSITVLHDLLPAVVLLAKQRNVGVFNFTNPGVISHNELLDLYIQYIDASYVYTNFGPVEEAALCQSRSNVALDSSKLQAAVGSTLVIPPITASLHALFRRMSQDRA
ncbi:hypothetical protein SPRG_09826 [Saprolegnia parasitica CBS 223.65]|uniref:NAD-dependent epimerase/dehydratase domain-containing protein n=1 Tax=Saprolegnia parasitica (strain CBS 223.65) TaxID=695850 RepID=A0A067CD08_SAPPC|nr:hypothetical protein SPRG_09826 [Saprolegnia parasitica CBS 223.65]KDO24436.1 hypothetical protein SPRG_09826 [Saprolegnia parasitica CBS 223.65]|eukprot:XP_012204866.1 hypothetical protein SPRG_09826 [Saprolegnia parasitica CBS 223.65]